MENLQNDVVFEKIAEITKQDKLICDDFTNKTIELLRSELENKENGFNVKHGFLSLSKAIIALSQTLCDSEEHYNQELLKAQSVAIDRVMPAILPKTDGDKIAEDDYDMENLSIRRLMMTIGTTIDYIFWRSELSNYSNTRVELEKELENQPTDDLNENE